MQLVLKQENGNSFKPIPRTTANADGTSTSTIPDPFTTEEKAQKKNDVKARSMLLMALPNEHPLTFKQYTNAKTFFEAIQARFCGNDATKKTQKTLMNTPVSTTSTHDNTANLSDATVYAFLANQPNGSQLVHEDLEQIHDDDLEEMDLKWQLALLSVRARRYFQRTGKKITINGSDIVGYDKTKVECFSCHKMRHFVREFRSPRNQQNMPRNQDSSRKTMNVEDTSSKAMVPIDGAGFDWSYMADDEAPTNMALMDFLDSEEFAPTAVLTKSGIVPISTARQSFSRAAAPVSAARPINTVAPKPLVNVVKTRQNALQKSHSLSRRHFYQQTTLKNKNLNNKINTAKVNFVNTAKGNKVASVVGKQGINAVKSSACWVWRPKIKVQDHVSKNSGSYICDPQDALKDQGYFDSGCSKHLTRNISNLADFKEHDGGYVAFGGGAKGGKITSKGTIRTRKLDFKDVYFVKELQFNLFSISQMCDKKNSVLFTDIEYFVMSPNFKLADESHVLLKVPRKNNMYSFDMKKIVSQKDLTCLFAKATNDESMLWHRRLGHINFKNINKLVKDNLVRGLPSKRFENNQTYVACLKGKQHKVSLKSKIQNSISQPLFMLHMHLFGPTFVSSIMHKKYCLVITDDFSRFTWVFFLATKDETSRILKNFITGIENLVDKKEKIIRCDNGTEFKNRVLNEFCKEKGIKRDYSVARTLQQNKVAERRNITLIEALTTSAYADYLSLNYCSPTYADYPSDPLMPDLEDTEIFDDAYDDRDEGAEADYNNLEIVISVSPIPFTRIYKDHPQEQIIGEMEPKKTLMDLPHRKRAIGTKWVFRNKRDQRRIIVRNKSRLVAQGHRQEEGIDYDEVYVSQPPGFMDLEFPDRVYKVEKALYGLYQAPRACVKSASTPMETHKPLSKDANGTNVDVHLYRSMIGLLMYLISSKPDIMFAVCACLRFQVQPKVSHMHAVKRIFRYLKGQPTLGLWYPKYSPLELIAYSDSDYTGVSLDRKSTTGGCQFLGSRLISWQCKKQTIMADSTTKSEYIAASNCCGQVLWLQNQLLDYGYNFMQTKIHVDNESAIYVVKNHALFSPTNNGMADLKFVDQHNMVAYLAKSDDNTEFHQIVDFLSSCSINYTLTVSPTFYASYIKQFWNTASSKTINSVKQIHDIVDGKAVVISKSLVRSDLLFDDEDGITCLTNDEIFKNLALMGYEPLSTKLTFHRGDSVERAITTDASLVATQDNDNIIKTQTTEMPNVDIPQGMDTGHTSRSREGRIELTFELTNTVPPIPHDSPLTGGYIPGSAEGRLKLLELMNTCTTLSNKERMIREIDKDKNVNLVNEQGEVHETGEPLKNDNDATLTKTLLNIKTSITKDKGKDIMQDTKLPRKIKKREMIQLSLDEELANETARQE
uniref:Putative ribonuclease H-like domain-containing protein n=1 Tax=Tanacetum cinerariifolium TaxID=118510 RepID=A0A6L2MJ58_TANCI|nr:putative ribonuclease H-like domain-containing protein [Tanacetum cinerariifolium]